jgi:hypothetical protein
LIRTSCPACKNKLPQWYLLAGALLILGVYAAFLLLEQVI